MEAGQLKTAFGAALLPVAEELMPDIIEGFKGLIDSIRTNKDDIKELAVTVGEFAKTSVDLLGGVADALEAIGGLIMTGPTGTNVNDLAVALLKR